MSTPLSATPNDHAFSPIGLNNNRSHSPAVSIPSPAQAGLAQPPRKASFSSQPQPTAGPSRLRTQSPNTQYPPLPSPQNGVGLNGQAPQGGQAVDQLHQARVALAQQVGAQNGQERRISGGTQDWASMAASMGLMNGQGLSRDAMIKQLHALHNTAGGRTRLAQMTGAPPASPSNGTPNGAPSPFTAPSPSAPSPGGMNAPSPAASVQNPSTPSHPATPQQSRVPPSRPPGPLIGLNGQGNAPDQQLTEAQKSTLAARAEDIRAANLKAASSIRPATQAANGRPPHPGQPGRPPDIAASRAAFQRTMVDYHRAMGTTPPPEIWANGIKDGALNVAGVWVYLLELFMLAMKYQGMQYAVKYPEAWRCFVVDHNIPDPLPEPVTLLKPPKSDPETPAATTTNPVTYLISVYYHHLLGFEAHLGAQTARKKQQALYAQAQAQAQAQGQPGVRPGQIPPLPGPGSYQPRPPLSQGHSQIGQPPQMSSQGNQAPPNLPQARPPQPPPPQQSQQTPHISQSQPVPSTPQGLPNSNLQQPGQLFLPSSQPIPITAVPDANRPPILTTSSPAQPQTPQNEPIKPPNPKKGKNKDGKSVPAPIKVDVSYGSGPVSAAATPIAGETLGKKRKREKELSKGANNSSGPSTPAPEPPTSAPAPAPVERPPTPKRTRYKVEYKPLHIPLPTLAGWDSRAVASTFPTHNMKQPARSPYELGIVDMEAVLMGLRSRLPRELGYAMTVLSMLSMPHPDDRSGGLPLVSLMEVYEEILEVVEEACFGDEGYDAWVKRVENVESSCAGVDLRRGDFAIMERIGMDLDWSMEEDEEVRSSRPRDNTGGSTDIVLAGINLLRNLTMLPDNQHLMGRHTELYSLIAKITDTRLARLPGEMEWRGKPYSIHELARVRRDSITILGNIGPFVDLRLFKLEESLAVVGMLSGFITCGWEYTTRDSLYGPVISTRDIPIHTVLSVNRALEAFVKLAAADSNREVLSKIPHDQLMELYNGLIRLLPSTPRALEAFYTQEEHLVFAEYVSHALYSLAFLSPPVTRAAMRNTPGTLKTITRIIYDTSSKGYEYKSNPFNVFCRRLCETLGVLNGTVGANGGAGGVESVGFGAGAGGGKGWRFNSEVVERGWLCGMEEEVQRFLGVFGLDGPAFAEMDGMWWAGEGL